MTASNASPPIEPEEFSKAVEIPLYEGSTSAGRPSGFQSPAQDYTQRTLDLNEHLVQRPAASFYAYVSGDSMTGASINDGDLILVDRSLAPVDRKIVYALIDGEFFVKRFRARGDMVWLESANPKFRDIEITEGMQCEIEGVVTAVIRKL